MSQLSIQDWQRRVHLLAKSKGWYEGADPDDPNHIASRLALIHSEVSEALECVRDGRLDPAERPDKFGQLKPEGLPSELADVVIRVLDLAEWLGIDLEDAVYTKHNFNMVRTHRHGGRRL